jgi:hypothetical protein
MLAPFIRVTRSGKTLTRRTWALLEDAGRAAGVPVRVVQGSWSRGGLSAGTHSGAGAFDLSVRGMTRAQRLRLVNELRKRNVAAWLRSREFGWYLGDHIHGIVKDEPGLSYGARRQVINYNQGLNGLASKRRDPHPRPKQVPFDGAPKPLPEAARVKLANLRYGKRNDDVRDLQRALGIVADGYYGPKTDAAVRAHQKRMGLRPDRVRRSYVGPKQAARLGLIVV